MTPLRIRYKFDPTGVSLDNYVGNETRQLRRMPVRCIIPINGAFYQKGFVIYDQAFPGLPLVPGEQYELHQLYPDPTHAAGIAAYGLVVITDTDVSDNITMSYQAVGGEWSNMMVAIAQLLTTLAGDNRSTLWSNLSGVPDSFTPVHHQHAVGDGYDFDQWTFAIERILAAVKLRDLISHDSILTDVDLYISDLNNVGGQYAVASMQAHEAAVDPHDLYAQRSAIMSYLQPIRKPINQVPAVGQSNVALDVTLTTSLYYSMYRVALASVRYQVCSTSDFANPEVDVIVAGTALSYHYSGILGSNKPYFWRSCFTDAEGTVSQWSDATTFTTIAVSIGQPTITSPVNGAPTNSETFTLQATAFLIQGATDTQASADWEIWDGPNGTGNRVFAALASTTNKTSITIPPNTFVRGQAYYPRVRYNSNRYGTSSWSVQTAFIAIWPTVPTVIGQAFGGGNWGGNITLSDGIYAIVVAPKASGEKAQALMSIATQVVGAYSLTDSVANTSAIVANGVAAVWARALNINGYSDWQVPAKSVIAVLQTNLLPSGSTTPTAYQTGGAEAFSATTAYWSSTLNDTTRDDSYTTGGDPIYGQGVTQIYSSGSYSGVAVGSPSPSCSVGTPVMTGNYENFQTNQGSYSWACVAYGQVVVGHTAIVNHPVSTPVFQAFSASFGTAKTFTSEEKPLSRLVRAVRLVKVAELGSIPDNPGDAYGGGYIVGKMSYSGAAYMLIAAPLATGEKAFNIDWSTIGLSTLGRTDGAANTSALLTAGSTLATWAHGLSIGGFTDWYIPSQDELELMYRMLKPTTAQNDTGSGINPSSIPPGTAYTATVPAQVAAVAFKTGGSNALSTTLYGSSSTTSSGSHNVQFTSSGVQTTTVTGNMPYRAVRKVLIPTS